MRSEPCITVECDVCRSSSVEVGLTTTAQGYDERNVDDNLERWGWLLRDGEDICPDCKAKTEEEGENVRQVPDA